MGLRERRLQKTVENCSDVLHELCYFPTIVRATISRRMIFAQLMACMWAGQRSRYSDQLRAGRSEDRISLGGETFRTCPDRPWVLPSLLYNRYRVFSGGKVWPGRDADPSPPSSAVVLKQQSSTSSLPTDRTACTVPQCLYKGALYLPLPMAYMENRMVA